MPLLPKNETLNSCSAVLHVITLVSDPTLLRMTIRDKTQFVSNHLQ